MCTKDWQWLPHLLFLLSSSYCTRVVFLPVESPTFPERLTRRAKLIADSPLVSVFVIISLRLSHSPVSPFCRILPCWLFVSPSLHCFVHFKFCASPCAAASCQTIRSGVISRDTTCLYILVPPSFFILFSTSLSLFSSLLHFPSFVISSLLSFLVFLFVHLYVSSHLSHFCYWDFFVFFAFISFLFCLFLRVFTGDTL
jgi:hypothetical protein